MIFPLLRLFHGFAALGAAVSVGFAILPASAEEPIKLIRPNTEIVALEAGEDCEAIPATGVSVVERGGVSRVFSIRCGSFAAQTASVYLLTPQAAHVISDNAGRSSAAAGALDFANIPSLLAWWRDEVTGAANCSGGSVETAANDNGDAASIACKSWLGGYDYAAMAAKGRRGFYLAQGYGFGEAAMRELLSRLDGAALAAP